MNAIDAPIMHPFFCYRDYGRSFISLKTINLKGNLKATPPERVGKLENPIHSKTTSSLFFEVLDSAAVLRFFLHPVTLLQILVDSTLPYPSHSVYLSVHGLLRISPDSHASRRLIRILLLLETFLHCT